MRTRVAIIGLVIAGLLAGCNSQSATKTAAPDSVTSNGVTVSGALNVAPGIEFGADAKPVTDLVALDIVAGTGAVVTPTSTVTAHYTGYGMNTKQKFDSSWDRGEPATFPISGVIAGWQQGLQGMKVGGRRLLIIPGDLGYGAMGNSGIEPNETLVFVVDLTAVTQ
jgi:peptidylprolyl isomerase